MMISACLCGCGRVTKGPRYLPGHKPPRVEQPCECGCGTLTFGKTAQGHNVRINHPRGGLKHGAARAGNRDPLYIVWDSMIQRCENPRHKSYENYGGRGIRVCDAWLDSFEAFRDDVGPRPQGAWLDRRDNDGHYEPGNVRWATRAAQQRNKRTTVMVEARGRTLCAADWARETGVSKTTLLYRAHCGLSGEEFLAPVKDGDAPCACGCGATAKGANAFATPTCRTRAWRRARAAVPAGTRLLTES